MGDDEEDDVVEQMLLDDSGFMSMTMEATQASTSNSHIVKAWLSQIRNSTRIRPPIPHVFRNPHLPAATLKPDYKLLFATHIRLRNRFLSASYSLSTLQTRGASNGHSNTIYCLQLYTYPDTGLQVLFTGSKDRTIREWDMSTGTVRRVLQGVHEGSVLSICAYNGMLASGGSDRTVVVWDLATGHAIRVIRDHEDSVLCVRFNDQRLVSCSKGEISETTVDGRNLTAYTDRTLRTYLLPDFTPQFRLEDHRAAVNAISMSDKHIVSGSGDRSMKIWNAETGELLQTFENHHGRGYVIFQSATIGTYATVFHSLAAIDFQAPYVLSGSSDKHLRLIDTTTGRGWSTSPDIEETAVSRPASGTVCQTCGSIPQAGRLIQQKTHEDLVRSVVLNSDFVVSGSYDHTVKVSTCPSCSRRC